MVNGRLSHMLTAAWKSDEEAFFFLFFCSAPNLVDPFHTVVVFFPATVEFEESRSLVANTWRTKYFESPRRILVVDRSKNSKKKNSVIFLGLFKQRIEFSIHSKTALNTRKGTEIHWNVIIETDDGSRSITRVKLRNRSTVSREHLCVDAFSFVFVLRFYELELYRVSRRDTISPVLILFLSFSSALLRSQVITHRKTIWNIIWRDIHTSTLFETEKSLLRL